MAQSRPRYTTVAIVVHWLIAAAIIFQIILGWRMGDGPKGPTTYALFQLHKSIGITILLLSLFRLTWKLTHKSPVPPEGQPVWERTASHIVHWGFYAIMIGLPLTGWIMVSTSRTPIPTLLYGVAPWPHLPLLPELAAGAKHAWRAAGEFGHDALVKLAYLLLALHLGAVVKHQIFDRDEVFSHMAAGARPGWKEPRAWLTAAGLAAVVAAGYLYSPAATAARAAPPASEPVSTKTLTPAEAAPPADAEAAAPESDLKDPMAWAVQRGSALTFTATWSGSAIEGRFKTWTANILFSPEALDRSKLTVLVDMASASTGDDQRDQSLPSGDFFDTAEHPEAVFTATRFRKTGEGKFVADGTLDLRGVKKPLSLPFSLKIDGDAATARGVVTLDRTMFGVGQGEWASTDTIAAKVKVGFQLTAKRHSTSPQPNRGRP